MATELQNPRMPPVLAWSLVVANILLCLVMVMNLNHRFESTLAIWLTSILAACDVALGIAALVWARRARERRPKPDPQ